LFVVTQPFRRSSAAICHILWSKEPLAIVASAMVCEVGRAESSLLGGLDVGSWHEADLTAATNEVGLAPANGHAG
jgi:hypothetical protein